MSKKAEKRLARMKERTLQNQSPIDSSYFEPISSGFGEAAISFLFSIMGGRRRGDR